MGAYNGGALPSTTRAGVESPKFRGYLQLVSERRAEKVLVVGSGAREHALARALLAGSATRKVIVAPGNAGMTGDRLSRASAVDPMNADDVLAVAKIEAVDLVVIGPEAPLCAGLADMLSARGFAVFGPSRRAARLEGSKAFLKEFALRHEIPTARFSVARTMAEVDAELSLRGAPIVVKADGLCAGKGVVVAESVEEARAAARSMLEDRIFGEAGGVVVLEEKLSGREVSVHAVSDGERFVLLPPARDHKRIFDGDRGPNTGGMGVICPTGDVSAALLDRIAKEIVGPTIRGMREEGAPFRGVLFAGVMVTDKDEPFLLEHNVRFGDPECEALMALFEGDVGAALSAAATGALDPTAIRSTGRHAAVVILAASGYPDKPRAGDVITGIEEATAAGATVHHAGTKVDAEGRFVTSGGRVLAVTATGASSAEAREIAYRAADLIQFDGKQLRRDIGATV